MANIPVKKVFGIRSIYLKEKMTEAENHCLCSSFTDSLLVISIPFLDLEVNQPTHDKQAQHHGDNDLHVVFPPYI